jgi:hypothetical protein
MRHGGWLVILEVSVEQAFAFSVFLYTAFGASLPSRLACSLVDKLTCPKEVALTRERIGEKVSLIGEHIRRLSGYLPDVFTV